MDSRSKKLMLLIGSKSNDVRMIGIYGMGGIGKTTIARVVYHSISCEFEGSSFLANVRETSRESGLVSLQKQLLCQIIGDKDINIWEVYDGIKMIRNRLFHKKVLIVIDDVDDIQQLNKIAGKHDWFGLGSIIIITTRDKQLLMTHGVDEVYKVEELDNVEALKLFSLKAFKKDQPPQVYMDLSKHVVKYSSGLPLALQVIGSFLFGKTIPEWESALQRLGRHAKKGILDSLQISFDGLKETEKKMFLDVACFFKGKNKDHVARIWEACGFHTDIGIKVLIDKSMLTISNDNELWMHDLLQEMGQQIVKRESPEEPGKRSRLWEEVDISHILTKNTGTEVVEGIILEKNLQLSAKDAKVFSKMINLRLLKISNGQLSEGLEYLSNELRFLEWHGYALKSLPSSLQLDNTVELQMHHSCLEQLWKQVKPLYRLKVIDLSHSKKLIKTPNFTEVPNLVELILEGCTRLRYIHSSLLVHKNLIFLNMKDCSSLTTLPREIDMESLEKLILSGCFKIKKFPEIMRNMKSLSELFLDRTYIKELPFPVELLEGLVMLSLEDCKNLESLPSDIHILKSLKTLRLSGCSKLQNVPEIDSLEKLDVSGTAIRKPTSSMFSMKNLKELSFRQCKGPSSNSMYMCFLFNLMLKKGSDPMTLELPSSSGLSSLRLLDLSDCNLGEGAIPSELFRSLVSLQYLDLSNNNFSSLPATIGHLSVLIDLRLDSCKKLQSLPELPSSLQFVELNGCTSLESLPKSLQSCQPIDISCMNCLKLLDQNNLPLSMLKKMPDPGVYKTNNIILPGSEIPKWFSHKSEGSSVRLTCHPEMILKGFALCTLFCVSKILLSTHQSRTFVLECKSKLPIYCTAHPFRVDSSEDMPDHIWLNYIPFDFKDWSPDFHDVEFKIESQGDIPGFEVKWCAAHPIYEEKVVKNDNPITDSGGSTSGNLIDSHQDYFASKMGIMTTEQTSVGYDGAESCGFGISGNHEPQTKRQKLEFS